MDQEFEESSEQKIHNEDEQQGLGLAQNQEGQSQEEFPEFQSQGQDQGLETQDRALAQGLEDHGQEQGQGQGKGCLFGREKPVHSALGGGACIFSSPISLQLL